jgi:hypothetical protein
MIGRFSARARRRAGALLVYVFSVWLIFNGIVQHIHGLITQHSEYTQNIILLSLVSLIPLYLGVKLFIYARGLWADTDTD